MNLPQAKLSEVRSGAHYVECENCARIIWIE